MLKKTLDRYPVVDYTVHIEYLQYGLNGLCKRGDLLNVIISNSAGIPIYEQIKEQIKAAIINGEVMEGELLPSIRQLARDLKISVITTTRAYSDLEQEGFVVNVQGKGCYVQPQNTELIREQKLRDIEESLSLAITSAKMIKLSDVELRQMLDVMLKEDVDG